MTTWEDLDAQLVNRVLAPWTRQILQRRRRRAEAKAHAEQKKKGKIEQLERKREFLEKLDGDRWIKETREADREAVERHFMEWENKFFWAGS